MTMEPTHPATSLEEAEQELTSITLDRRTPLLCLTYVFSTVEVTLHDHASSIIVAR